MISKRGVEALKLVGSGQNIDRTADAMGISRSTVEKHLFKVKHQLGAKNLMNAVYIAAKGGLILIVIHVSSFNPEDSSSLDRRRVLSIKRTQESFLLTPSII